MDGIKWAQKLSVKNVIIDLEKFCVCHVITIIYAIIIFLNSAKWNADSRNVVMKIIWLIVYIAEN